ncbi:15280_t:CDS:2 [Funneliformis geosporum]|nr:15280_t:CDS:2 [Funneliformis geosporum]
MALLKVRDQEEHNEQVPDAEEINNDQIDNGGEINDDYYCFS